MAGDFRAILSKNRLARTMRYSRPQCRIYLTDTEDLMDRGNDFLKLQVRAATAQHLAFFRALEEHEAEAEDARYRDLCTRYMATMRDHQRMLEDYQSELGVADDGVLKRTIGATVEAARNLADAARESDYARLLNDMAMSRQAASNFRIFREGARVIGLRHLTQIGAAAERDHNAYKRDADRLAQQMFAERARNSGASATKNSSADARQ